MRKSTLTLPVSLLLSIPLLFSMCKKSSSIAVKNDVIVYAPPPVPVTKQINAAFGGYYISLPDDYDETKKNYPLLLFLHGAWQMGDGSNELKYLLNDGIGKLLNENRFPASFSSK